MGRQLTSKKSGQDYDLTKSFVAGGSTYSKTAADALKIWLEWQSVVNVMFPTEAPLIANNSQTLIAGKFVVTADGSPAYGIRTIGQVVRQVVTTSDAGNDNMKATPIDGYLSPTSGIAEGANNGTAAGDQPFCINFWAKRTGEGTTTDFLFGKSGAKFNAKVAQNTGIVTFELTAGSVATIRVTSSAEMLSSSEFTMLTFTYDGRGGSAANLGMKMYANGEEVATSKDNTGTYDGMDFDLSLIHI